MVICQHFAMSLSWLVYPLPLHPVSYPTMNPSKRQRLHEKKVEDAVRELNYTFKSKAKTSKYNIGCIMAVTSEKYGDPFFNSILASAEEESTKYGMAISSIKNYNELKIPLFYRKCADRIWMDCF